MGKVLGKRGGAVALRIMVRKCDWDSRSGLGNVTGKGGGGIGVALSRQDPHLNDSDLD